MKNLTIDFIPKESDFKYLIGQLDKYGFYCAVLQPHDRNRILKSFDRGGFIVLKDGESLIGFTVWAGENQWTEVQYKWILPEYRGQGIGRYFSELIFQEFIKREIYLVLVQPATDYGWGMARTFGFKPLSETDYRFSTNLQYLMLKDNRETTLLSGAGYELLIWHNFDNRKSPAQIYKIDETMEKYPIISIVDGDSWVELQREGVPIVRNVCKRFFSEKELQYYGLLYFNVNLSSVLKRFKLTNID